MFWGGTHTVLKVSKVDSVYKGCFWTKKGNQNMQQIKEKTKPINNNRPTSLEERVKAFCQDEYVPTEKHR